MLGVSLQVFRSTGLLLLGCITFLTQTQLLLTEIRAPDTVPEIFGCRGFSLSHIPVDCLIAHSEPHKTGFQSSFSGVQCMRHSSSICHAVDVIRGELEHSKTTPLPGIRAWMDHDASLQSFQIVTYH